MDWDGDILARLFSILTGRVFKSYLLKNKATRFGRYFTLGQKEYPYSPTPMTSLGSQSSYSNSSAWNLKNASAEALL